MKTKRLINALIWAFIGITIVAGIIYQWHKQSCGIAEITIGSLWFASAIFAIAYNIDDLIRN